MEAKPEAIATTGAAAAIGPYSQAVRTGQWLFVSGQIPLDPATGAVVSGGIGAQTERVMKNLAAILDAAGASFANVVRTTVFLTDLDDFAEMNAIYATFVGLPAPARSTIQVAALPKSVRLEIDAIAVLPIPRGRVRRN